MAARDQNLQLMRIYVALVSFLCAIFLVGWIWSGVTSSTKTKQMEELRTRADTSEGNFRRLSNELQLVQGMLGVKQLSDVEVGALLESTSGNADVAEMQTQWQKDMGLFGPNVPQQDRNYKSLVTYLMQELRARNLQVDNASKRQDELVAENRAVLDRETAAARQERERADSLEKQLAAERQDFTAKLEASQKTIDETSQRLTQSNAAHAQEKQKLSGQIASLQNEAEELRTRNAELADKRTELEGEEFQSPQGKISVVALGNRTVYVNLGKTDGLAPGVRFSVMDPNQTKMSEAVTKAQIEVVEVSQTSSRARVLEDLNGDPIVPGDLIYSPAWQPGRKVQFALLGRMDINNDGSDDRELLKDLIRQSGGEITEELLPDGRKIGEMTVDTRWLVVGEAYRADDAREGFGAKYADMQKRARGLGVSQINLDKVINWIRSRSDDRTIPFGSAARAVDVREQERMPISAGKVSDLYNIRPENSRTAP